jgi:hypothetical protein
MMRDLPRLPPTRAAWVMLVLGVLALLVSLWAQGRMWAVEFGMRPVAAGGGEYMVALFFALPLLLLALLLLGISVASRAWSSWCARAALGVALVPTFGWLVVIARDFI